MEETITTETTPAETTPAEATDTAALVTEADTTESMLDVSFEPVNFVDNLSYMGVGMLGIFIVIGLIMTCTFALNKIFSGKDKK